LEERKDFKFFASCTFRLASSEFLRKMDLSVPSSPEPAAKQYEDVSTQIAEQSSISSGPAAITDSEEPKNENEGAPGAPIEKNPGQEPTKSTAKPKTPSSQDKSSSTKKTEPKKFKSRPVITESFQIEVDGKKITGQYDAGFGQMLLNGFDHAASTQSSKKKLSKKKAAVLHGMPGGPAGKAIRERALTEEPRQSTPSGREPPVVVTNPIKEPHTDFEDYPPAVLHAEALDIDGKPEHLAKSQDLVQSHEPLTPPPSTKKPQQQALTEMPKSNVSVVIKEADPKPLAVIDTESTQSFSTILDRIEATVAASGQSAPGTEVPINTDSTQSFNNTQDRIEAAETSSFASNATTKIPESEDIARAIEDQDEPQTPDIQRMRSPILGNSPMLKHQRGVSFAEASPADQQAFGHECRSVSLSPIPRSPIMRSDPILGDVIATQLLPKPISFKRKSIDITGTEPNDSESRKRSATPSAKLTDEFQRRIMGAQARIAAAREEKQRLEEEAREAMAFKAEREKVLLLEKQAVQMERENAEWKVSKES
jgi:hypothetical protein